MRHLKQKSDLCFRIRGHKEKIPQRVKPNRQKTMQNAQINVMVACSCCTASTLAVSHEQTEKKNANVAHEIVATKSKYDHAKNFVFRSKSLLHALRRLLLSNR